MTAYWAAAEQRDWEAFGALVAENVVYEAPQSRERVRGRSAYLRFNREGFPAEWHLETVKVVGGDRAAASWISMAHPDGTVQPGLSFFEIDERGLIARITDFWPTAYEPVTMTVQELLAAAKRFDGSAPDGQKSLRTASTFRDGGMTGTSREVWLGENYRVDSTLGPFVTAEGRNDGQQWTNQ